VSSEIYREPVDPNATNNPHSYALQMTGSGHRVLEVGCSVGHVTEHLVAAGNTVVGVEIDAQAAAAAEEFAERVHVVDLDTAALSTIEHDEFDVIILGDVLEHLRDPAATLADLLTLLTADGRVIISVPNVAHVDVRLMLLEGRWEYQSTGLLDATHLRWFTKASLHELLQGAGLVATRLERVRVGRFGSDIELDPHRSRTDAIAFIEADPESSTFQFVVEAVRLDAGITPPDPIDILAEEAAIEWPSLDHATQAAALAASNDELRSRITELETHNDALRAHLDAWERSTLARVSRPLRAMWGRVRRIRSS
jgi:2-polyprenyl-3-methyl-5-hydroxy-6-metoxy-1,4-benzoquinol methylase